MAPSMKALGILAERLGVSRASLLGEEVYEPPIDVPETPAEDAELVARLSEAERVLQAGRYEEAIARFEEIGQRDRASCAHARYAHYLANQGRYQEAYEQMRRAFQRRE